MSLTFPILFALDRHPLIAAVTQNHCVSAVRGQGARVGGTNMHDPPVQAEVFVPCGKLTVIFKRR